MGKYITNFIDENGIDLGAQLVDKDYLIDVYPQLLDQQKAAGLWTWGAGSYGILGNGTTGTNRSSPVQTIAGGATWKQVACGGGFSAAIKTDGTLWTWGGNTSGTLGDNTRTHRSSPVQTVAGGTTWKHVSCGSDHVAALKTDGTLWTWGHNGNSSLGDNTIIDKSSPVQTVAGGTNWKQVACGGYHTMAIKTDGTLWGWGDNFGTLGDNTETDRSSPVQTVAGGTDWMQISCGEFHTAAIKLDGTLWTWGFNDSGQLGDNSTINTSSPAQTVTGGTDWKQVSCGGYHTMAIKTDGTLWLWGANSFGQLGDGTRTERSSPIQVISGGTNWKTIAGSISGSAGIKTDGTLWMWGRNNAGQLGDNTTSNRSSPVQTIAGGTSWKQVAGYISSRGLDHTAAIKEFEGW